MNVDDLILVSVDDHIVEPPDMFEGRLPAKYRDKAPRFVLRDDGANVWVYEGHEIETWANNAVVGRPPEEFGWEPQNYDDVRPAVYDVHERVKDMSANGEWAALCFPTFPRFAGSLFPHFVYRDPDQALAMIRAYNDWHLEGWCAAYPDRFIPLCLTPFFDVEKMVKEVRRVAGLGVHAVTFPGDPYPFPSLFSESWDPFWSVCQELGVVVCMHLGAGASVPNLVGSIDSDRPPFPEPEAPRMGFRYVGRAFAMPGTPPAVAADLLNSRIFDRFPNLRISLSEGGIGWVPYFLEQADFRLRHHGAWSGMDFGGRMPSEIFTEHVLCCFIEDAAGIAARSLMNVDMLAWECDYPHSDCTWPKSPETLASYLEGVPDDEVHKITHANAARVFQFDPFSRRTPDRCTVKALRDDVFGHDITIRARGRSGRASKADIALKDQKGSLVP